MPITSKPTWAEGAPLPRYPRLQEDLRVDVAVVGGGLAGTLAAYELSRRGRSVALLEADRIGSGATVRTTGFLTKSLDTDTPDLTSMFEPRGARIILESHQRAIEYIAETVKREKVDCEFTRCANVIFAREEGELSALEEEYEALRKLGVEAKLRRGSGALGFRCAGFIEVLGQAKFHPTKFIAGLLPAIERAGGLIFEKTEVTGIRGGDPVSIRAVGHRVRAGHVITATYDPFNKPRETFAKKGMYVSYVQELRVPLGTLREGTYEDLANPYHYFRVDRLSGSDRVIIGGEDHRKELPMKPGTNFRSLAKFTGELLAGVPHEVVRRWSGPILEPSDGLALIGEYRPRQLVATAFSGNGMTYSGIAAELLADVVTGKKNPCRHLYDPTRSMTLKRLFRKALDYGEEFFGGAVKNAIKP